ncbi:MAG TPA: hypothetical protein VEB63_08965 [Chitinophagaceae bacterium]|nr:hypothetical protein [Chitinophagaceae bacterium]
MKKHLFHLLALGLIFLTGCQKELSFETGGTPSEGSLAADVNGDCLPKTVNGTYIASTALTATNTITVQVNVTTAGSYTIGTDTVNGIHFRATGTFTATGANTVTLRGAGTPFTDGTFNFVVSYDSTFCDVQVTVLPAGSTPGQGTLGGAGGACTPVTVNGTYTAGTALTASNTVTIQVNVTTPGTFNISTNTVDGFSFSFTGNLSATGAQNVNLLGTGTPGTAGTKNFTVTLGGNTCTFSVTVGGGGGGAAVFTVDCATAVVDGFYEATSDLNPCNTVDLPVNVTTAGTYSITTTPINGMTFSASGSFSSTGPTIVTLQGTGRPANQGTFNVQVPGTPSCTFPVTVAPAPVPVDWRFNIGSAPAIQYQGQTDQADLQPAGPGVVFIILGSNSIGSDDFQLALLDANGTITNGETYSSTALTGNQGGFAYTLECSTDPYQADPTISGVSMTFTVTSHDVATKTISGTFSGTARNSAGTVTITGGTFRGTYP